MYMRCVRRRITVPQSRKIKAIPKDLFLSALKAIVMPACKHFSALHFEAIGSKQLCKFYTEACPSRTQKPEKNSG